MGKKIKVLLVDDHEMFRDGIKSLLSMGQLAEVIGEATNGREFIELLPTKNPDVVLMDIAMPVMNGIEAARIATKNFPEIKILVLSMFGDEKYYCELINAGVKGFVLKSSGINELLTAIKNVAENNNSFSTELLVNLINNMYVSKISDVNGTPDLGEKLSRRELEVLKEIASGLSCNDISKKLHISPTTVRTHKSNLFLKTATSNTTNLIMYAIKNKIIELDNQ